MRKSRILQFLALAALLFAFGLLSYQRTYALDEGVCNRLQPNCTYSVQYTECGFGCSCPGVSYCCYYEQGKCESAPGYGWSQICQGICYDIYG